MVPVLLMAEKRPFPRPCPGSLCFHCFKAWTRKGGTERPWLDNSASSLSFPCLACCRGGRVSVRPRNLSVLPQGRNSMRNAMPGDRT